MGIMQMIGDGIDAVREWAFAETNSGKMAWKAFIAGAIDGWEYGCLIIGNIVCTAGLIASILNIFKKDEEEEEI